MPPSARWPSRRRAPASKRPISRKIRTQITEGTSALFLVTEFGDLDRLGERFQGTDHTLISTNLTDAERDILLEVFGGEVMPAYSSDQGEAGGPAARSREHRTLQGADERGTAA